MNVCKEAQDLVHGNRQADYGPKLPNMQLTADLWSPILGVEVTAEQVALCMVQLKIAREIYKPKRDNRVDGCGYFEVLDCIYDERAEADRVANVQKAIRESGG